MKSLLARGAIWITATRAAINIIGFGSTLLLARLLLPKDFGLVAIASAIMAVVASVTEISLASALVQHRDPSDDHYHTAFTLGVIRAFLSSAVTAALAWPVAALFGDHRLVGLLLAFAAASALGGLINPKLVQLTRALVFRQEFILGVSNKLVGFAVAAFVAIVWRSYWALVVGTVASQISYVIVSYRLVRYRPRLSMAKSNELLSFSIWLTLSQVVSALNYRFDTLFLGYFLGKTPLGYYSFGDNLANMVTREAVSPVANILFPAFARISDDPDRLRAAYFKTQGMLFAIALPVGVGFALIAEPFILLVLGEKWRGAILVVQVVAAATGIASIGSTYMPLSLALGRTRSVFNRDFFSFFVRVPILIVGFLLGGLAGFLAARVVSGLINLLLNMSLVRSLVGVGLRRQIASNVRPVLALLATIGILAACSAAMGGLHTTALSQIILLAIQIALGGTLYAVALWIMWVISGRPDGIESEVAAAIEKIMTNKGQSASQT
jgi:O-antigen/teichoic acid export membrane protein